MTSTNPPAGSLPLDLRIHILEQRLLERRERIGAVASGIGRGFLARMTSPGMLIAAVGLGVFLHRSGARPKWSMLTLLNAAHTTTLLVVSVSSWLSPAPQATPRSDMDRSRLA